ncbi:MAG: PilZ domain-containing protein [Armatimonadetes bacterium]|nr:PilZ domain-containing protein [Armatimonadota bacterium]
MALPLLNEHPRTAIPCAQKVEPREMRDLRLLARVSCELPVFGMALESSRFFTATVKDVSLGGLRLEFEEPTLRAGETVKVKPGRGPAGINCRVVWTRGYEAGLQFLDPPARVARSWVLPLLCPERGTDQSNRRRYIRVRSELPGIVGPPWGGQLPMTVLDLGLGGGMIRCDRSFARGTKLFLRLGIGEHEALETQCEVVNCQETGQGDHRCHVRFLDLSPAQMRLLGRYVVELLKACSY